MEDENSLSDSVKTDVKLAVLDALLFIEQYPAENGTNTAKFATEMMKYPMGLGILAIGQHTLIDLILIYCEDSFGLKRKDLFNYIKEFLADPET